MSAIRQDYAPHHTTEAQAHEWNGGEPSAPRRRPLLDKPSDPHPILNLLMDEALCRIMLTADGAVAALRMRVTGSKDATVPTSDLATLVDGIGERFQACRTHRARLTVIHEAQRTLDRLRYAPRSEMRGTIEWKRAIGADERSSRIVASVYGVSKRDVTAYRKAHR